MNRQLIAAFLLILTAVTANAAFVIEVDTDGAVDGPFTPSTNFSFGGDTTTASTSSSAVAFGLSVGNSLFGGDGAAEPDTYLFTYTPDGGDVDNLVAPLGTSLNTSGDTATGLAGGLPGFYAVYAVWPLTQGVSGGPVAYDLFDNSNTVVASTAIDQNNLDGQWVKLFEAPLAFNPADMIDDPFILRQQSGSNTFVSMRAQAVLFEYVRPIPEPAAAVLVMVSLMCLRSRRVVSNSAR